MPKYKYKYKYPWIEIPELKTVRELIENGHNHPKGGDNVQYIYSEKKKEKKKDIHLHIL